MSCFDNMGTIECEVHPLLQGLLDKERYLEVTRALLDQLRADARLDSLTTAIDGQRLLAAA